MAEQLRVEVVYARPRAALRREVEVPAGATVAEAVRLSGIAEAVTDCDVASLPVACFGRAVSADVPVAEGDRLELLRPLCVDPKEARRLRRIERGR